MSDALDTVTLWWNGSGHTVLGENLTAGRVLAKFLEVYPTLEPMDLALFTTGMAELEQDAGIRNFEELIVRPRVLH